MAARFVTEARSTSSREDLFSATQSFNLDMNPFMTSFSPFLIFVYYRTTLAILQNLALVSATAYVADHPLTGTQISKWLGQHFQSIVGAFSSISSRKGFLLTKDYTSSKNVDFERCLDFRTYATSGRCVRTSVEVKLCRLSVSALRSARIKNRPARRPITRGGAPGAASVYFKRDDPASLLFRKGRSAAVAETVVPPKGCLAFLLYRHHARLFPSCGGLSCLSVWQKICANALPRSVEIGDAQAFGEFVRVVLTTTREYHERDVIDIMPDSLLSYANHRFHNFFLCAYGHRDYISCIVGFATQLGRQNPMQYPYILGESPRCADVASYIREVKARARLLTGASAPSADGAYVGPMVAMAARAPNVRDLCESRSVVTVSFGIDKYSSGSVGGGAAGGGRDIFQFAQIGYFVGSGVERSMNVGSQGGGAGSSSASVDYRGVRQRCLMATPLVGRLIRKFRRESNVFEGELIRIRVRQALESDGSMYDPETLAVFEIIKGRGGELVDVEELLFLTDGQVELAEALGAKVARVVGALGEGFEDELALEDVVRVLEGPGDAEMTAEAPPPPPSDGKEEATEAASEQEAASASSSPAAASRGRKRPRGEAPAGSEGGIHDLSSMFLSASGAEEGGGGGPAGGSEVGEEGEEADDDLAFAGKYARL